MEWGSQEHTEVYFGNILGNIHLVDREVYEMKMLGNRLQGLQASGSCSVAYFDITGFETSDPFLGLHRHKYI
jgi:hypothetical protein